MPEESVAQVAGRPVSGSASAGAAIGASVNICLVAACLVLFNFFPEKVGYFRTITDPSTFVPLLAPGFTAFLPAFDLWWALALALEVRHLARRRWTTGMQWARVGLDVMGAALLATLAVARPFTDGPAGLIIAWLALPAASLGLLIGALARAAGQLRALANGELRHGSA